MIFLWFLVVFVLEMRTILFLFLLLFVSCYRMHLHFMFIAVSNHCEFCQMFFHWCFMYPHWGFWNKLLDLSSYRDCVVRVTDSKHSVLTVVIIDHTTYTPLGHWKAFHFASSTKRYCDVWCHCLRTNRRMHSCIRQPRPLGHSFSTLSHLRRVVVMLGCHCFRPNRHCLSVVSTGRSLGQSFFTLNHPRRVVVMLWCHCRSVVWTGRMHSCIRKPGSLGQSFSTLNHPTSYCDVMASLTEKDPSSSYNLRHLDTRSVSILHHPRRVIVNLWWHCLTRIYIPFCTIHVELLSICGDTVWQEFVIDTG